MREQFYWKVLLVAFIIQIILATHLMAVTKYDKSNQPKAITYENNSLNAHPNCNYMRQNVVGYATNLKFSSPEQNDGIMTLSRNYNLKYERFDNAWTWIYSMMRMGSDCASFVSQALVAGGIKTNNEWHYRKILKPYSSKLGFNGETPCGRDMTPVWARAKAQYDYFSNRDNGYINGEVITISSINEMREDVKKYDIKPGDLLFWADDENGVHHSTIITGISKDGFIKYSGHCNDRVNQLILGLNGEQLKIVRIKDDAR